MGVWTKLWRKSFDETGYRISLHVLFWVLYFLAFSFWDYFLLSEVGRRGNALTALFFLTMVCNVIIICSSYYITERTAYRYLAIKHQYGRFFVALLLSILFFCVVLTGLRYLKSLLLPLLNINQPSRIASAQTPYDGGFARIIEMIISYFALLCLPLSAKFFRDQLRHQKRQHDLQQRNLQLQMDFLKSQIHPHFLFNTLNNIYSLTTINQSQRASKMIAGLSALLRYSLYEGKMDLISLNKEVTMLREFINLEAVRSDDLELCVNLPDDLPNHLKVPPFLLLPLVENAFKHGVNSQLHKSALQIKLTTGDKNIELVVSNSFDPVYRRHNSGGIGLTNLRKRLDYYYHANFTLDTVESGDLFTAHLIIPRQCPRLTA